MNTPVVSALNIVDTECGEHTCNPSTECGGTQLEFYHLERGEQKTEFKASLAYIYSLRPAWATWPSLQKKEGRKSGREEELLLFLNTRCEVLILLVEGFCLCSIKCLLIIIANNTSQVVAAHACNPSTQEAEAGRSLEVQDNPGLPSECQDSQSYTERLCLNPTPSPQWQCRNGKF